MSAPPAAEAASGERSDHELVAWARRGDDRAFELLYQRYHGRILAYAAGMVRDHGRAEDLTQEIFFSAVRRMRETERPIAFRPWLHEIARNACIDQFRRTRRAEEESYHAGDEVEDPRLVSRGPAPEAAVDAKEQLTQLCSALGGLSDSHHQILVLREFEGLSYREIGERMGLSRAAVESTLFRARRRLSEEYDELASGRRCQRVQGLLAAAAEEMPAPRDRRRLARHLSHCQPCRRQARALGLADVVPTGEALASRLAAIVPLPVFLRPGRSANAPASANGQGLAAQWAGALGSALEPLAATWSKAAVALVALAVAGAGTEAATRGARVPSPVTTSTPREDAIAPARVAAASVSRRHPSAERPAALTGRRASGAGAGAGAGTGTGTGGARPRAPAPATGEHPLLVPAPSDASGGGVPPARLPEVGPDASWVGPETPAPEVEPPGSPGLSPPGAPELDTTKVPSTPSAAAVDPSKDADVKNVTGKGSVPSARERSRHRK